MHSSILIGILSLTPFTAALPHPVTTLPLNFSGVCVGHGPVVLPHKPQPAAPPPAPKQPQLSQPVSYSGPASSFPDPSKWATWDAMSAHSAYRMNNNATQFVNHGKGVPNNPTETQWVLDAVQEYGKQCNVDPRFALATIIQESHGQVRVQSTTSPGGVPNTGVMQAHDGATYDPASPRASVRRMVKDGVCGTASGDGLSQLMGRYQNVYVAARGYNSGDGGISLQNLGLGGGATNAYVSDIANRLMNADIF